MKAQKRRSEEKVFLWADIKAATSKTHGEQFVLSYLHGRNTGGISFGWWIPGSLGSAILIRTNSLFTRSNSTLFKAASGFPWCCARTRPRFKNQKKQEKSTKQQKHTQTQTPNPGMIPTAGGTNRNKQKKRSLLLPIRRGDKLRWVSNRLNRIESKMRNL